jgi:hypothetical protein
MTDTASLLADIPEHYQNKINISYILLNCLETNLAYDVSLPAAVDGSGPGCLQTDRALHPLQLLCLSLPAKSSRVIGTYSVVPNEFSAA